MGRWAAALAAAALLIVPSALAAPAQPPPTRAQLEQQRSVAGGTARKAPDASSSRVGKSRCDSFWAERYAKNLLGSKLFTYRLTIEWCWRRSRITRASWYTTPDSLAPFWSYASDDEKVKRAGGKGRAFYRVYAQGHFHLCGPVSLGCIQDKYPWVRIVVRGSGATSYDTGGT